LDYEGLQPGMTLTYHRSQQKIDQTDVLCWFDIIVKNTID